MNTEREPTDDQLRDAWRAVARPEWGSYEQAKASWVRYSIARSRARLLANGHRVESPPPALHTPAAPATAPQTRYPLRVSDQPIGLDRKRLAAGERDDD